MRGALVAAVTLGSLLACTTSAHAQTAADAALPTAAPSVDDAIYPPPAARWKVIALGLGTTAIAYGAAAGMSYAYPDAPGARDLRAPLVGPWLAIAHNGCSADEPDCSKTLVVFRSIVSAIDAVAQVGGLAIALEGLFMTTQLPPSRPLAPSAPSPGGPTSPGPAPRDDDKGKNLFFLPTPMALGSRGVGFGVVGRF